MVANQLLKQREGAIAQGKIPAITFERIKFDELVKDIRNDYRINGKGLPDLDKRLRHLKPFFGGVSVPKITTTVISDYIQSRLTLTCKECGCKSAEEKLEKGKCPFCKVGKDFEPGAANGTVNRELAALKRMLNIGKQQNKVDRVPYVPSLKEDNVRKGFFEHGEFLALRNALPSYLKGFVTFAYKTGWRVSEISGLTWSQVDLTNGIVMLEVGETKNKEARTVYLDDELKAVFQTQWECRNKSKILTPFVFPNRWETRQIGKIGHSWNKACKDAKIGKRLFHDFRRTAVRNMVRSGVPESVAMKVSGHKTRSVFERYNIVNDRDLQLAAQRQEAYLKLQSDTISDTIISFEEIRKIKNVG
jgi:integrase